MKLILLLWVSLIFSCQHSTRIVAGKFGSKSERDYFSQISSAERADILHRAEVFVSESRPIESIDVIEDVLKKECSTSFNYRNGQSIQWPEQSCTYVPDKDKKMGGGSSKFLCEFQDPSDKKGSVVKTVKYSTKSWGVFSGEVHDVLLATNLAKLMGFPVTYYCPVRIKCKNCPSDNPWKNNHGADPGKEGSEVYFEYAMIGKKINAAVVSESSSGNSPIGVGWNEIKSVSVDSEDQKRRMLIERETWMLWTHFLQNTDHYSQNTHLACESSKISDDGQRYFCEKPLLYTHDYGYAFHNHLNLTQWEKYPTLVESGSAKCEGILSRKITKLKARDAVEGLILDSNISEESKSLFLEKIQKITDEQWRTTFQLAHAREISLWSAEDFLMTVKRKISELQSMRCSSFDEKKTVLSRDRFK